MANVSEHDSILEGKGDDGEDRWVDFLVVGDTIGVDDVLEGGSELVGLDEGGRLDPMVVDQLHCRHLDVLVFIFDALDLR